MPGPSGLGKEAGRDPKALGNVNQPWARGSASVGPGGSGRGNPSTCLGALICFQAL